MTKISEKSEEQKLTWAPISGIWEIKDLEATFTKPEENTLPCGLVVSNLSFRSGEINVKLSLNETQGSSGRIVFGYNCETGAYFSVGLGGYGFAYILDEFIPSKGWNAVIGRGSKTNLTPNSFYDLVVSVYGQTVRLTVNGVKVLESNLPHPITGNQVGLFTWGSGNIQFKDFVSKKRSIKAFVVMQFGEPFDSLYRDVIVPVANKLELEAYRADDVFKPGIILQDIIKGIMESEVIIAEITPVNANVFYELGYAHALGKPTILLATRGECDLPFDIRSYRVIFYDNSIAGKNIVEKNLKKHLENVLGEVPSVT